MVSEFIHILWCNNGGGGGNFSKVKRLLNPETVIFRGFKFLALPESDFRKARIFVQDLFCPLNRVCIFVPVKVAKGIVIFRTLSLYSISNKSISSLSFSCGHDLRHAL